MYTCTLMKIPKNIILKLFLYPKFVKYTVNTPANQKNALNLFYPFIEFLTCKMAGFWRGFEDHT